MAKRKVSQSNHRNAAEYSMQRWKDTEQYSRALFTPEEHDIPPSWLLGLAGNSLKAVLFHRLAPQRRLASTMGGDWRGKDALRTVSVSTEELSRAHAPNALNKFWRRARHPQRSFLIREGSTVSVLQNGEPSDEVSDSGARGVQRFRFCRVRAIGTIAGKLHLECEAWKVSDLALSIVGNPAVVTLDSTPSVSLVRAERVEQSAFVLPCGTHNVLFTRSRAFILKVVEGSYMCLSQSMHTVGRVVR